MGPDLFSYQTGEEFSQARPLADRMRPKTLADFVGQVHAVGKGTLLHTAIENDRIFSMILWGPPGCGKTTLARIIAAATRSCFVSFSAVLSGVKQIREVVKKAEEQRTFFQKKTLLFVDEIHRFNKAQQDAFLQHVESGLITLIGATTENPSFEVIPALMSRCRIIKLKALYPEEVVRILTRALADGQKGFGDLAVTIEPDAMRHLSEMADGDARTALNGLEAIIDMARQTGETDSRAGGLTVTLQSVERAIERKALRYDKGGDDHYNLISALHKSLRGSDPDAAVYWTSRMLNAGEDPLYVLRRMVRFASEDVGMADPQALSVAMSATDAYRLLGAPEGELAIVQAAVYLATAPKSNRLYVAHGKANETISRTGTQPVPLHIRNAPTSLMKGMGYGKGYKYAHDYRRAFIHQEYLPEKLRNCRFYSPTERGFEKKIKERLDRWNRLKQRQKNDNGVSTEEKQGDLDNGI